MLVTRIITGSMVWTVPLDWSNFNTIEVIGGGGGGGSFYRWDGGSRLVYGYGGSGAGYIRVENLNLLVPGQNIVVTVGFGGAPAATPGMSGGGPGSPGGSSLFGSYLQATGGQTQQAFPFIRGGNGFINLPVGSYSNFLQSAGSSGGLYSGGSPGAGGLSGRPGFGNNGRGGNSQSFNNANPLFGNVGVAQQPGQPGVVVISYTPSGTHQASVWIS